MRNFLPLVLILSLLFISCGSESSKNDDDTTNLSDQDQVETSDEDSDTSSTVDNSVDETTDETVDEVADEVTDMSVDETNDEDMIIEGTPSLIISELSSKVTGRFVEIFNATDEAVSLSGYSLEFSDGTTSEGLALPTDVSIASKDVFVISKKITTMMGAESDPFKEYYGFAADLDSEMIDTYLGGATIIKLITEMGTVDVYGETASEDWKFESKSVFRNFNKIEGMAVFDLADWTMNENNNKPTVTPGIHMKDGCAYDDNCENWEQCSTTTHYCELKDGACEDIDDCEGGETCEEHLCVTGGGSNIILNGGFEAWTTEYPDSWTGTKTILSQDASLFGDAVKYTVDVHGGNNAAQLLNTRSTSSGASKQVLASSAIAAPVAGNYICTYWIKGNGKMKMGFYYMDNGSTEETGWDSAWTSIDTATWEEHSFPMIIPANATDLELLVRFYDTNFIGDKNNQFHLLIDDIICK